MNESRRGSLGVDWLRRSDELALATVACVDLVWGALLELGVANLGIVDVITEVLS